MYAIKAKAIVRVEISSITFELSVTEGNMSKTIIVGRQKTVEVGEFHMNMNFVYCTYPTQPIAK